MTTSSAVYIHLQQWTDYPDQSMVAQVMRMAGMGYRQTCGFEIPLHGFEENRHGIKEEVRHLKFCKSKTPRLLGRLAE
ncbi:uncharacterized protein SPSK_06809 [Sporothrix schenckii 1099-18]|uniref:Uncharacterized protein n=1 Tax=Sporothrix schenckii 1099-18 TaxID=1397361 RepID=A0A0F2MLS4_SPOSC|nr:uncharacterized protein SPSK_06809 [Sporothrix schenckii 1099-18]KJR89800.1 hypothetical protein SPSK_06809 [Sporothrix schenckii 1099-18]